MSILIKLFCEEPITIHDVSSYAIVNDYWKVIIIDGRVIFFNKNNIVYIGDQSISFY